MVAFGCVGEQAAISGFEDMERRQGGREEHQRQRKQGQASHDSNLVNRRRGGGTPDPPVTHGLSYGYATGTVG